MNSQISWQETINSNSPYRDDRVHSRESLFEGLTLAARCSSGSIIFGEKERTVKAPDHGEKGRTIQGPVEVKKHDAEPLKHHTSCYNQTPTSISRPRERLLDQIQEKESSAETW